MDLINFEELTDDEEFLELVAQTLMKKKIVCPRTDHFSYCSDDEFFYRFRLSKAAVAFVLDLIKPSISNLTDRNHAVDAELMLLTTLRFYATGSFLNVCGDFSGLHKSTVSRIIRKVSRAIASLRSQFIYMPSDEDELRTLRGKMFEISNFPKCVGAIDCTHIRLQSPGGQQSKIFRNRKGFFSLNVQTISDADLKIRNIVVRWPGSTDDATIFHNSNIKSKFESGEMRDSVLVGDRGYPLISYLLTPLANPSSSAEELFNESLTQARNVVERSYRAWKRRFPVLAKGIRVKMPTAKAVVVSTAILHNIACDMNLIVPEVDEETRVRIEEQQLLDIVEPFDGNETVRDSFITYFQHLLNTRSSHGKSQEKHKLEVDK